MKLELKKLVSLCLSLCFLVLPMLSVLAEDSSAMTVTVVEDAMGEVATEEKEATIQMESQERKETQKEESQFETSSQDVSVQEEEIIVPVQEEPQREDLQDNIDVVDELSGNPDLQPSSENEEKDIVLELLQEGKEQLSIDQVTKGEVAELASEDHKEETSEKSVEETLVIEDPVVEIIKAVSENAAFEKGFVSILRPTIVYKDKNHDEIIATIESGIIEAMGRENSGTELDQVYVDFDLNGERIIGYIDSTDVRPCNEEEVTTWRESKSSIKGVKNQTEDLKEEETEVSEVEEERFVSDVGIIQEIPEHKESLSKDEEAVNEIVIEQIEEEETFEFEKIPEHEETLSKDEEAVSELVIEQNEEEETIEFEESEALLEGIPDSFMLELNADPVNDRVLDYPRARNWELTLPNAGRLAIYVNPSIDPSYTGTLTVNIWNEAVDTIYVTTSGSSPFIMDNIWLDAGKYNVVVDGAGLNIVYSIRATFSPATNAITGYKSTDNPYALASSTTFTRSVFTIQDNVDYYLFEVSEPSHVSIMTRVYEPGVIISIIDASDLALGSIWALLPGTEAAPIVEENDEWLEPGRYYIVVRNSGAIGGIYDIYASSSSAGTVDAEPNDGRGIAIPVNVGSSYQGMISMLDNYDYYEITVDRPTEVGISLRESTDGLDAKVYDSNMSSVLANLTSAAGSGSSLTNPKETYAQVRMEPNRPYYLEIKKNSDTGLYSFVLSKKLTVDSVTVSPTGGGFGTTFRITPTVSNGTPVVAEYRLYKKSGSTWVDYWHERTLNPVWDVTALGYTAAQQATWAGTWKVAYMVYDGYSWTSQAETQEFTVGGAPVITSIDVATYPLDAVNVGFDFEVKVTTTGTPVVTYVYDIVDSHNVLLKDKRQILSTASAKMHVDAIGTGYRIMVSVFDGYGGVDVDYSAPFEAVSSVSVTSFTLTANGTLLTATLNTKNGSPVQTKFDIYCNDALVDTKTVAGGNSFTYEAQSSGTYYMIATIFNGSVWLAPAASNTVVVADKFEVYSVQPNVTSAAVGDYVTFSATVTGNVKKTTFYLNRVVGSTSTNVDVWTGTETSHTYQLILPGSYAVYAIISDGITEKHMPSSFVTVSIVGTTVVSVTTDTTAASVGQKIKATLVTAGAPTVKTTWYVQTTMGAIIKQWEGNSHSYVFDVPTPGAYIVTCAVFGFNGDSGDFDSSTPFNVYP